MKKKLIQSVLIIIALVVIGIAYWLISPLWRVKQVNDVAPISTTKELTQGETTPKLSGSFASKAHNVSGTVSVINTDTEKILRFENFMTINGPDLRIYLATDGTAKDYIDLGEIKGAKGNINYTIPHNTDLSKYSHVLVWCRAFSVLFGEADLHLE